MNIYVKRSSFCGYCGFRTSAEDTFWHGSTSVLSVLDSLYKFEMNYRWLVAALVIEKVSPAGQTKPQKQ